MKIINCNMEINIANTIGQNEGLKEILDNVAANINKSINETFSSYGVEVEKVLMAFDIESEVNNSEDLKIGDIIETENNIEFGSECKKCRCDECDYDSTCECD